MSTVELAEPNLRFISFTTGRRECVGYTLGSLLTYMMLARLLQTFEWRLARETSIDFSEEEKTLFNANLILACASPRFSPELMEKILF